MPRWNTLKDYQERMNKVMDYIQRNLGEPIKLDRLAKVACFSPFHFHRLFAALSGESLNRYIRRLRLERAAQQLCHSRQPITTIALAAGYETPSAFNKAFRQHFKKSPSSFRRLEHDFILHTGKTINLKPKKETAMKPKLVSRPEKKILFVRKTGPYQKAAEEAWTAVCRFAYSRGLVGRAKGTEFIGISYDDPNITAEDKLRYDACLSIDTDVKPEGEVGVRKLGGGKYAVFLHKGPYNRLNQTYQQIFGQWLPTSGQQLRDEPSFEIYLNDPNRTKPENLKTEIYVPIR